LYILPHGPFDGVLEIGIFEDDERVAATELHRRQLKVLPSSRCDASSSGTTTREGYTLDSSVVDEMLRLLVGNKQIGVQPSRRTSFNP
jgi:hypothetical protein